MKTLEKKVHFTAEGTSIGCYDSKGIPMRYLLIEGEPYISLVDSVDRLLNICGVRAHNSEVKFYENNRSVVFACIDLAGVVNGKFVSSNHSIWKYAERQCTHSELASFHLAKYKAHKNALKLEVKNG